MNFAYLLILLAATAWGSIGIPSEKLFTYGLEPKEVIWFRAAICFGAMFLYCLIFNRLRLKINHKDILLFLLYGLISVTMFYYTYFNAIEKTGVAMAAILLYTAPAMVVVLSRIVFYEAIDIKKIVCIILTIAGCFLVVKGYDLDNLKLNISGILLGIAAGFCYAMYSIFGKKFSDSYHPWTVIIYSQGFGVFFLTFLHFPANVFIDQHESVVWIYLFYIGLVPTLMAYLCYNAALKHVEPGRASIVATLEPVMAVTFAFIFLGQVLEAVQTLGALLVILAVIIVQLPKNLDIFKNKPRDKDVDNKMAN